MENTFKYRVSQVLAGDYPERDNVPVCDTPELIHKVGFLGKKIVMEQNKLRLCLAPESLSEDNHDLPIDFMDNLPQYVESPAMILSSLTRPNDSIVLVTDCKDKDGDPIVIALRDEGRRGIIDGEVVTCDKLASAYGKDNFAGWLKRSIIADGANNGLLYWNEKKSRDLAVSAGLQLPGVLADHDSNVIIRKFNENVNPLRQKSLDFSPDGYGNTVNLREDTPFAYSDPDGRRKLYEYTKDRNGDEVLSSTTATFSDGRSEITRYDERGEVTGIERRDAEGRKTYVYSRSWNGAQHEISYENFSGSRAHYDYDWEFGTPQYKGVHEKEHKKEEGRYGYHDKFEESWHEYDGSYEQRTTLAKHNEYRDDGVTPQKYYCSENRFEYDRYGNVTSAIYKDRDGTSVIKNTYYSSSEWYDYCGLTPEDTDGEFQTPQKSRICRNKDGRLSIKEYEVNGDHTELEYSAGGKLERFRDKNGASYTGQAAERAYLKSQNGKAPSIKDIAATLKAQSPNATHKSKNAGSGGNTGNGGHGGSSGAGR